MERQIIDLLTKLNVEVKSMRTDMTDMRREVSDMKTEMHQRFNTMDRRFNTIEAKLDGIGGQFELTNESSMNDVEFIANKVNKLEREVFILKHKNND
ncbi:hypothetical protein [Sutcliffiella deserti]|uniref:hypothetical protein n=1 Tax=Sutcliffiella deserti TaxID=2875501 RepID=UPI001CC14F4C|nr:hypothetical protein [Sutcliffiella deserti]